MGAVQTTPGDDKQGACSKSTALIMVVDDEASIRRTLEGILSDEGFSVIVADDGEQAIALLRERKPQLVLLDIWMPGRDGIETLKQIKQLAPETSVIMMSGHATIATAIMATRLGASDFIEKPLDLDAIVTAVKRALVQICPEAKAAAEAEARVANASEDTELSIGKARAQAKLNPVVFTHQAMRGDKVVQKTLAHSALMYGQGLHSGKKSGLILEPLPANAGIHFVGVSETTVVPAHVDFVESTGFATTLRLEGTQAGTIEHLMSALHAYGISNLLIKCNGEVPVLDGSAQEFCALFDEIGTEEQEGEWYEIAIRKTIRVGSDREYIQFEPADTFSVQYTLDYPAPVGRQELTFTLDTTAHYRSNIAPARTFGFVKDIGALQKQGLALGGRFDNFVLFGDEGPINDKLRFSDEPVRHKILDAIGDLYLLGRKIRGKVVGSMTGHSDNINLLKALRLELEKSQ